MTAIYKVLANTILARQNCEKSGNDEWYERWDDRIDAIMETAPSGSGFDSGTHLVEEDSTAERLRFHFGYHHMDGESGMYTHWTHHYVTVTGSLCFGFKMSFSKGHMLCEHSIGGSSLPPFREECPVDDLDLDYFHEVFDGWLNDAWDPPEGW